MVEPACTVLCEAPARYEGSLGRDPELGLGEVLCAVVCHANGERGENGCEEGDGLNTDLLSGALHVTVGRRRIAVLIPI